MTTAHPAPVASFATDPEAALASYLDLGYHIEENVLTPSECEALIRASENTPSFQDGTFAPLMQVHRSEPVFLSALRNPTIVKIMERLVSGRVSGLQSVFYFGPPGTPGWTVHQDNSYIEADQGAFASAWTALQDVTPEMGGLIAYPGSHREPLLQRVATNLATSVSQIRTANSEEVVLPPGYEPVDLVVPTGAVVFLHGHFVHASYTNRSDRLRRAVVLTYIRSGAPFRAGDTARRVEVPVY